ncbi:MAG: hypothetical protein JWQ66_1827 [Mucilaginibacter sp.]|nr:hypothetical protein [Mucilaginibacter sp.]
MKTLFIIPLNLLLFTLTGCAQQRLSGSYKCDTLDIGQHLTFKDNDFEMIASDDVLPKKGNGTFIVKKDSLFLQYKLIINKDSSIFTITKDANNEKGLTYISVIYNEDQQPAKQTAITIRNEKLNWLKTDFVDSLGRYKVNLSKYPLNYNIEINKIGYESILIPIKRLINFNNIQALLKPQHYYIIQPHEEAFQLIKLSDTVLNFKDNKRTFRFKKEKL